MGASRSTRCIKDITSTNNGIVSTARHSIQRPAATVISWRGRIRNTFRTRNIILLALLIGIHGRLYTKANKSCARSSGLCNGCSCSFAKNTERQEGFTTGKQCCERSEVHTGSQRPITCTDSCNATLASIHIVSSVTENWREA
jgi:hypothetical protein